MPFDLMMSLQPSDDNLLLSLWQTYLQKCRDSIFFSLFSHSLLLFAIVHEMYGVCARNTEEKNYFHLCCERGREGMKTMPVIFTFFLLFKIFFFFFLKKTSRLMIGKNQTEEKNVLLFHQTCYRPSATIWCCSECNTTIGTGF